MRDLRKESQQAKDDLSRSRLDKDRAERRTKDLEGMAQRTEDDRKREVIRAIEDART
jgi:hypothetical protein